MRGHTWHSGLGVAALFVLASASCALDERALRPRQASTAGSSGLSDTDASAEAGGAAGDPSVQPLPQCDYATGVSEGCDTLVTNPGFTSDVSGWTPEIGSVAMSWSSSDANQSPGSGSLVVVNSLAGDADGISSRGASQCLPATPGKAYGVAADVFIPDGQGLGLDGGTFEASAGVSMIFYEGEQCDGYTSGNATSDLLEVANQWQHREGHVVAPKKAASMAVRLVTFKNFREYKFEARFDNVLVKEF